VFGDPTREVWIDEEVLTERFLRTDAVPGGDLFQRAAAERRRLTR
jgi:hypothetical protein